MCICPGFLINPLDDSSSDPPVLHTQRWQKWSSAPGKIPHPANDVGGWVSLDLQTESPSHWGVMLPWTQPRSPGLFLLPSHCHRITLQSNELNSAVVRAARLLRAPSIGDVRYLTLRAGGFARGGAAPGGNFSPQTLPGPDML